ncbi:uncharacterized protein [Haliotis asinina]|uniref:uncharacterized protein n=1 Tax=Haliotis asinina TaxID=109174 RepID=UPI003531E34D
MHRVQSGSVLCFFPTRLNPERKVGDLKEAFNFTPGHDGPWPEVPVEFKPTFVNFHDDCTRLAERILDVLSICLELEDRYYLRECHNLMGKKGGAATLRSLYYPVLPETVKPGQVRCGEHSDYGTTTLLFQDDIGGLEVMNADDMCDK